MDYYVFFGHRSYLYCDEVHVTGEVEMEKMVRETINILLIWLGTLGLISVALLLSVSLWLFQLWIGLRLLQWLGV